MQTSPSRLRAAPWLSWAATLGCLALAPNLAWAQARIYFFPHANFVGTPLVLTAGQDVPNLTEKRLGDGTSADRAFSSVLVDGEATVELFDAPRHGGNRVVLRESLANLDEIPFDPASQATWNDRARSLRTIPNGGRPSGALAILYPDDDYRGMPLIVGANERRGQLRLNDTVSSVRVLSGGVVTLFEDADFQGQRLSLNSDTAALSRFNLPDGRSWNDQASSVSVAVGSGGGLPMPGLPGQPRPPQPPHPPVNLPIGAHVILFGDDNYRGQAITLRDGEVVPQLFPNDSISSVRLVGVSHVTLYADADYGGESITLTSDTPSLRARQFNDRASSATVGRAAPITGQPSPGTAFVVLYGDDNFQGNSVTLRAGEAAGQLRPNDAISSVRVFGGASVTLFEHGGFGGRSLVISADTPSLRALDFNDAASSARVAAPVGSAPPTSPKPRN